jgi:hypothetical protein
VDTRDATLLEQRLTGLQDVSPPDDLEANVLHTLRRDRRLLGLQRREWAFVGAAFSVWVVTMELVVSWAARSMTLP